MLGFAAIFHQPAPCGAGVGSGLMNILSSLLIPVTVAALAGLFFRQRRRLGFGSRAYTLIILGLALTALIDLVGLSAVQLGDDPLAVDGARRLAIGVALILILAGIIGWLPSLMSANDSLRRISAIDMIARAIGRSSGEGLYFRLIAEIARVLDAKTVFVGLLCDDGTRIRTVAVHRDGAAAANFTYDLVGSPCAGVLRGESNIYSKGVAALFPDDRPLSANGIEGYAANGLLGADGRPFGLLVVLTARPLADPELAQSVVTVFSDRLAVEIERERVLQALAESRDQLLEAQAMAQIGDWRTVDSLDQVSFSPAIAEMAGLPQKPVQNISELAALFEDPTPELYLDLRRQAMLAHQRFEIDVALRRPDGERRWISVIGKPAPGSRPTAPSYHGLIQDITARKHHESELLDAYAAKTQFIAIMSHELRTPLNPIQGFAEILADTACNDLPAATRNDYAREIVTAAEHMRRLVDDILDLTDIELNKITLDLADTDLRPLIKGIAQQIGPQVAAAQLDLQLDLPETTIFARIDARRVRQILFNLLSNAIKFTKPGGWIRVSAAGDAVRAEIAVTDCGAGMDRAQIDRLLHPFRQGESGLHRSASGLGLGLAISTALAEAHRGRLEIDSRPGIGTRVTLRLPRFPDLT